MRFVTLFNITCSLWVVVVVFVVAWLVGLWLCLEFRIGTPIVSWFVYYFICRRGFANHKRVQAHCGWVTLAGVVFGVLLFPQLHEQRMSITDELFLTYGRFGLVNLTLIVAAGLMFLLAVLECLNEVEDGDSCDAIA